MNPDHRLSASSILSLFSALDDVYFFMKDRNGYFIGANALQLEKLGLEGESELVGKRDEDFFPSYMTAHYIKDDARVMSSRLPLLNQTELVANPDGSVSWHITSKFPLLDLDGDCCGIVGYMRDLDRSDHALMPYRRLSAVVDFISSHYHEPLEIAQLAKVAHLSISQFERRFRKVFGQTPARFLIRYRLTRASHILVQTESTISQIAHQVGFYDHSHFSREFKNLFGLSPGNYRNEHSDPHAKSPSKS